MCVGEEDCSFLGAEEGLSTGDHCTRTIPGCSGMKVSQPRWCHDRAKQGCVCWAEPGWQKAAVLKRDWFEQRFLESGVEHPMLSSVPHLCWSMCSLSGPSPAAPALMALISPNQSHRKPLVNEGGFGQQSSVFGNWAPVVECITLNWLHMMWFFYESV